MINHPLVSICIPTYNSALFLEQTLNAIAAQTYKHIEVIISDNASTDETPDIIQPYCDRYGWTFYRNEVNIGAGNNFNKLLELANGEYIAIYHADDIYDPTIVEKSVQAFQQSDNIGLVGTMGFVIDSNNQILHPYHLPATLESIKQPLDFDGVFHGIISSGQSGILFITPSVMVRKECYDKLGSFKIHGKYKSAGDYEMWLRIAKEHLTYIINEPLIRYRIHPGQGSELEIRQNLEVYDIVTVLDDYQAHIQNRELTMKYQDWREAVYLNTALRQNTASLFSKSKQTLIGVKKRKYSIPKMILHTLNALHIPIQWDFFRTVYRALFK